MRPAGGAGPRRGARPAVAGLRRRARGRRARHRGAARAPAARRRGRLVAAHPRPGGVRPARTRRAALCGGARRRVRRLAADRGQGGRPIALRRRARPGRRPGRRRHRAVPGRPRRGRRDLGGGRDHEPRPGRHHDPGRRARAGDRDPGSGVLDQTIGRASVALAAVQLGVAQGALRLAAGYLGERRQFGRPLATFQAVQHQLADCYIDIEAMGVTMWQAVTSLEAGEPADAAVLVAKWWAGEAGLNVVHRTQHLHGGIGVDVDYPVHRHFLWGKQISGTLGGASADLARLGAVLAAGPVAS
ncbi:acyl-CoA dehydrogenase family protein [Microtetraspora malaysiensis]|uniref:acyl-CoA dehydrogenase family protein n=1 Tax=Microtetraspora malaysiensis TaxID=161358 RepID=UPI003D8BF9BA